MGGVAGGQPEQDPPVLHPQGVARVAIRQGRDRGRVRGPVRGRVRGRVFGPRDSRPRGSDLPGRRTPRAGSIPTSGSPASRRGALGAGGGDVRAPYSLRARTAAASPCPRRVSAASRSSRSGAASASVRRPSRAASGSAVRPRIASIGAAAWPRRARPASAASVSSKPSSDQLTAHRLAVGPAHCGAATLFAEPVPSGFHAWKGSVLAAATSASRRSASTPILAPAPSRSPSAHAPKIRSSISGCHCTPHTVSV